MAEEQRHSKGTGVGWKVHVARLLFILLLAAGVGLYYYSQDYYRPSAVAEGALQGNAAILFEEVRRGDLVFAPVNATKGVILYPGGKVSERAYGHLARQMAEEGYQTVILRMPLKLAILGQNRAAWHMEENPHIEEWVLVGHSLGGVAAAGFTARNPEKVTGLVLLAAYPAGSTDLTGYGGTVHSLVGDRDNIVDLERLAAAQGQLPASTVHRSIPGGNHGSFANYGLQEGDLMAEIGYEAQQQVVLESIRVILGGEGE